ncbi:MAG: DNA polymerase III subunit epsilon [Gammaproteobacteria bacterium]|nr:DNA polymerase III subunit epsilon [Gammaproteobacteria bacterium]
MRQIVLDTETTGLDPRDGHRIIEIGAVEILDRQLTHVHYHQYIQPDREIDAGALEVHGITQEFLADKPRFADVADAFIKFIRGAELIIHNAPFDVGFINAELERLGYSEKLSAFCQVVDTLALARDLHPGQKNNLDALCKRYGIDNSQRQLHGALLDSEILAEVYLTMTGGQVSFSLSEETQQANHTSKNTSIAPVIDGSQLTVIYANADECQAHETLLDNISKSNGGACVWRE